MTTLHERTVCGSAAMGGGTHKVLIKGELRKRIVGLAELEERSSA